MPSLPPVLFTYPVHDVALLQKELAQVGAVLAGHTRQQGNLAALSVLGVLDLEGGRE
jgi:hypothetical protein